MYRQVQVHRDDQDLQLILWRKPPNILVETYSLTTVAYGLFSAPFLAFRCIQQLANDEGENYPKAAEVVHRGTYVDNVITGADNFEEAISLQNQLHQRFTAGGFPFRKWMSSDSDLLEKIPHELRASSQLLTMEFKQSFYMLGLSWNPQQGVITFEVHLPACLNVITKRTVLSQIDQLFDPLEC
ncbi:uncharacterized protein LOC117180194 [Belonocnema kinseyi]|uniref:uncharacterized protein LOC117180194 n=1 Tax=Belonocnema kinseyi TaxID=2817044 RepID=UPI00143D9D51|nr:uncharacterized protein LOC117180194 [Belonocnema kinseyi]